MMGEKGIAGVGVVGVVGKASVQSMLSQDAAALLQSTTVIPRSVHDGQQTKEKQASWRSPQTDPVDVVLSKVRQDVRHSTGFAMMHCNKASLSSAQLASTNGGRVMSEPPDDGISSEGGDGAVGGILSHPSSSQSARMQFLYAMTDSAQVVQQVAREQNVASCVQLPGVSIKSSSPSTQLIPQKTILAETQR
jgi:hypothetical protein